MKTFAALPVAAGLVALASAQQQYYIDPTSVSDNLKETWCSAQTNTCPYICTQVSSDGSMTTNTNTCDASSLSYSCICGDGTSPNVTEYTQTLPFFVCQTWGNQCVSNCGTGNNDCASACRQDHPCGAQNPKKANETMTSTSMTGTKTSTDSASSETGDSEASSTGSDSDGGVYTGIGGAQQTGGPDSDDADSASDTSGAASALMAGQTFGLVAVVGAFFGGFALLL